MGTVSQLMWERKGAGEPRHGSAQAGNAARCSRASWKGGVRSGMPGTLRSSEGGSGTWFAAIAGRDGVPRDQMVTIT